MISLSQQAREFADMTAKKRKTQGVLDELNETLAKLEEALLTRLADEGVASLKVETDEGKFNLFPKRQLWSSCIPGHEAELNDGLRALGYGDLIREQVNSQRLSSLIREFDTVGQAVPPEIVNAVKVSERFTIGVRKA